MVTKKVNLLSESLIQVKKMDRMTLTVASAPEETNNNTKSIKQRKEKAIDLIKCAQIILK